MKKMLVFLFTCLVLASCSSEPEEPMYGPPGVLVPLDETTPVVTTPVPTTPSATSSHDEIPPLTNQVELLDGEGDVLDTYSELIWCTDGTMIADGYLMFHSVPSRLSAIADRIPLVILNGVPTVRIVTSESEIACGGEVVSVYDADYSELAHCISWQEAISRGRTEWSGKTVYLYFSVCYSSVYDYVQESSTAYFIKVLFPVLADTP